MLGWVFLKELTEFVLSPSNHLVTIGPKLDENTLHIKASSWAWIAIFCLNWLMCSTGSIRPLYMVNVGWWNCLGSLAFSIPRVKGDLEIWLRNLTWCLLHNVSSHSFARRTSTFSSVRAFFIVGEGFAWWSSWPLSINSVLFIIGRDIGAGRCSLLLCSMELLLQVINLLLHGFIIISPVGDVASPSKTASTCMGGMYTTFLIVFPISFTFKIEEIILLMNVCRFYLMRTCLMWTWFCHI